MSPFTWVPNLPIRGFFPLPEMPCLHPKGAAIIVMSLKVGPVAANDWWVGDFGDTVGDTATVAIRCDDNGLESETVTNGCKEDAKKGKSGWHDAY